MSAPTDERPTKEPGLATRSRGHAGRRRPLTRRGRQVRAAVLVVVLLGTLTVGVSVTRSLLAPGTDTTAARLAEWARTHGLGWAVTSLERAQYAMNKPTVGGTVAGGIGKELTAPASKSTDPRPTDIVPVVAHPLPSEGVWQPLLEVHGRTAAWVAFLRPDPVHTSYLVSVVWMSPKLLRFAQHPGSQVPGGSLTTPNQLQGTELSTVLASFNGGFQMVDARGGYWQNGETVVPLRRGAASMVISRAGDLTVEAWPGGTPGPDTASVRQNLVPLVDHGVTSPLVASPSTATWGATVGNAAYVWRSAVGTRSDGARLFVVGPAMSVATLAKVLESAGAVDAMELDINRSWTNFLTYTHTGTQHVVPHLLTADMHSNPYRYLQPSTRDFVAVLPR